MSVCLFRSGAAASGAWSRTVLVAVLASFLFPADVAEARGPQRHAKLDRQLNAAAASATNGESNVIIEFHSEAGAANLVKAHGAASSRRLAGIRARAARIANRKLRALADDPRVKRVHADRPVRGLAGRTAATVGARAVQELMGYTGAGVGVAVIDSGITGWHDDLTVANGYGQRVLHFADFINGYTRAYDDRGHGTHVAGIVAGNGFDSDGTRNAIAPGSHIVALKALDGNGHSTISTIIEAIDYAIANKDSLNIRVINLSLGAAVYESYNTDPLTLATKRAVDAGIVVVAAAGNLGKDADGHPQYGAITAPGNAPWVITVGASSTNGTVRRQDDTMASFSSRGPTMYDYAAKPDLVAPGYGTISLSDPLSLFYTSKAAFLLPGTVSTNYMPYLALSGTSMAAPVVAGTVALMLQANPELSPNLIKAILQFTSQEYPGYNPLTQGTGFLNARGAVRLAEYFRLAQKGSYYPPMAGWSRQIFWGNRRVTGGVLTPGGTAWGAGVTWGAPATPAGINVVWGENCLDSSCDNVVWGNTDDDNVVWGNGDGDNVVWGNGEDDNVVWGNSGDDNVVWGNDCGGENCDNVVWGNSGDDNVVWGNSDGDNVVWGNSDVDNVVWGNNGDDNVVWGNSITSAIVFGDETDEVNSLPSRMWDSLFPLDAPSKSELTGRRR